MRATSACCIVVRMMSEHAVFWTDSAEPGTVFGGGAAVEAGRLRLRGSDGRLRVIETLPAADLAAVDPDSGSETIGGFPTLRLDLAGGRSILVAAALGSAALVELVENLVSALPTA